MKQITFLIGLTIFLSGCATTAQNHTLTTQLQLRVGDMERKLEQKEEQIKEIKYEIRDLAYDIAQLKKRGKKSFSSKVKTGSSKIIDDDRVIRVDVDAMDVQKALKNAGVYNRDIDGNVGSGTKAAISTFQQENGLKADGIVGKQTWDALRPYLRQSTGN